MLKELSLIKNNSNQTEYPFNVPAIQALEFMEFNSRVTFFIGENGTGKSTLLEAIAVKAGLNAEGGSQNFTHKTSESSNNPAFKLAENLKLSWSRKILNGYFFRAESFFTLATELERIDRENPGQGTYAPYGGESLHKMSHGQSFFALFGNRLKKDGFYLFDEPEAALSPQRQLSFLVWLNEFITNTQGQCIIATHSPIILSFPEAQIFSFNEEGIKSVKYKETPNYNLTKDFLNNPEVYLRQLLK